MFRDKNNFEDSTLSPKILLFKNFGTYFFRIPMPKMEEDR